MLVRVFFDQLFFMPRGPLRFCEGIMLLSSAVSALFQVQHGVRA